METEASVEQGEAALSRRTSCLGEMQRQPSPPCCAAEGFLLSHSTEASELYRYLWFIWHVKIDLKLFPVYSQTQQVVSL